MNKKWGGGMGLKFYINTLEMIIKLVLDQQRFVMLREAVKSHNRLNLGKHPNREGVSKMNVVSQPLTFAIITI